MINKRIIPENHFNNFNNQPIQLTQSPEYRQPQNDKKLAYNFTVAVRVKPNLGDASKTTNPNLLNFTDVDSQTLILEYPQNAQQSHSYCSKNRKFTFDYVFIDKKNRSIYQNLIKNKLDVLNENMNLTLFTYGITGSGKTHTIFGNKDMQEEGLAMMVFSDVIKNYRNGTQNIDKFEKKLSQHNIRCDNVQFMFSYMQIYNQQAHDLLKRQPNTFHNEVQLLQPAPQLKLKPLNILQDSNGRVNIPQLTKIPIDSIQMIEQLIEKGNLIRACSSNMINKLSSRSHAILQLYCMDRETKIENIVTIIDLAGSERHISLNFGNSLKQKSRQKDCYHLQKQGSNINKSLLALANCLKGLQNGQTHIPYRDSKLTRILKDDLSGKSHNIMIACVGRNMSQADEIVNTLQYASRAVNIKVEKIKNTKKNQGFQCEYCWKLTPWRSIISKLPEWLLIELDKKKQKQIDVQKKWKKQNFQSGKRQQMGSNFQLRFQNELSQLKGGLKKDIIDMIHTENPSINTDRQQIFQVQQNLFSNISSRSNNMSNMRSNNMSNMRSKNIQQRVGEILSRFEMKMGIFLRNQLQREKQRSQQIFLKAEMQQKKYQHQIVDVNKQKESQIRKINRALSEQERKVNKNKNKNKNREIKDGQLLKQTGEERIKIQKQERRDSQKQIKLFNPKYYHKNRKNSISSSSSCNDKQKQREKYKNKNCTNLNQIQPSTSPWQQKENTHYFSNIRKKINITNNNNHIFSTNHSGISTAYTKNNSHSLNLSYSQANINNYFNKVRTQRMNPDVDQDPDSQWNNSYKNLIIKKIEQAKREPHNSELNFLHQNCSKIEFQYQFEKQNCQNGPAQSLDRDQIYRKKKHSKTDFYMHAWQEGKKKYKSNNGEYIKIYDNLNRESDIQISSFRQDSTLNSNSQKRLQIDTSVGLFEVASLAK